MSSFDTFTSLFPQGYKPAGETVINKTLLKYGVRARALMTSSDDLQKPYTTSRQMGLYNSATPFRKVNAELIDDINCSAGFCAKVVGPDGFVNIAQVQAYLTEQRQGSDRIINQLHGVFDCYSSESCVSLIYNLLRLYYFKRNYMENKTRFNSQDLWYDNGHISVEYKDMFDVSLQQHPEYASFDTAEKALDSSDYANLEECIYLNWPGDYSYWEVELQEIACGAFTYNTDLAIMHKSPKLINKIKQNTNGRYNTVLNKINSRSDNMFVDPSLTSTMIMKVIKNLVEANKLYSDFDQAYLMLAQIFWSPVPRSAEACIWYAESNTMYMPRLCCSRGLHPSLTSGIAYEPCTSWKNTYVNWNADVSTLEWQSVLLNEAAYTEAYNFKRMLVINKTDLLFEDPYEFNNGIKFDMRLLSTRYGQDIHLIRDTLCGYRRIATSCEYREKITIPVTAKTSMANDYYDLTNKLVSIGGRTELKLTGYVPLVFPVLTLGINYNEYFMNGTEIECECELRGNSHQFFDSQAKVAKYLNIMRVFGYDVTVKDMLTRDTFTNWADNGTARFLYDRNHALGVVAQSVHTDDIIRRQHCFHELAGTIHGKLHQNVKFEQLNFQFYNQSRLVAKVSKDLKIDITKPLTQQSTPGSSVITLAGINTKNLGFQSAKVDQQEFARATTMHGASEDVQLQIYGESLQHDPPDTELCQPENTAGTMI